MSDKLKAYCKFMGIVVLVYIALLLMFGSKSDAHEWYTGKKNPVTGLGCCNMQDCRPVHPNEIVFEMKDGVRGYRWLRAPKYETGWIPENQVLISHDDSPHVCWWNFQFRCLMIPSGF